MPKRVSGRQLGTRPLRKRASRINPTLRHHSKPPLELSCHTRLTPSTRCPPAAPSDSCRPDRRPSLSAEGRRRSKRGGRATGRKHTLRVIVLIHAVQSRNKSVNILNSENNGKIVKLGVGNEKCESPGKGLASMQVTLFKITQHWLGFTRTWTAVSWVKVLCLLTHSSTSPDFLFCSHHNYYGQIISADQLTYVVVFWRTVSLSTWILN